MNFASSTIETIYNTIPSAIGAFLGAFFAFCFFLVSKWVVEKYKHRKTCRKEHSYLDRHFQELKIVLEENKNLLELTIASYEKERIDIVLDTLVTLPLREDSSMKIDDNLFINRLETYTNNGIKKLNRLQEGIIQMQKVLNNDLMGNNPERFERAKKMLPDFFRGAKKMLKLYNYYLDITNDLTLENKILLKKYKKVEDDKKEKLNKYEKRQEEIKNEKISYKENYFNPLIQEQKDKLKKYGLLKEEQE